tara:strand:+ start:1446 stop:1793 length:348 start_codon:yes stop_codon:yes gene_type:complete
MNAIDKQYITTYTSTSESQTKSPTSMSLKKSSPPDYYIGKYKELEAFDVCMDFSRDSYNLGVAIAYLLRAGKKPDNLIEDDILKAIDHLNKELEYIAYDRKHDNTGIDPTKGSFT